MREVGGGWLSKVATKADILGTQGKREREREREMTDR